MRDAAYYEVHRYVYRRHILYNRLLNQKYNLTAVHEMKTAHVIGCLIVLVITGLAYLDAREEVQQSEAHAGDITEKGGAVILELYTSQGCSSCPPAEAVLRKLAADRNLADAIVPLAFHVDYWDYLGWRDPYSNAEWTQRQGAYLDATGRSTLYTPQLVVHGRHELVGSDESKARSAIDRVLKEAEAHAIEVDIPQVTHAEGDLRAEIYSSLRGAGNGEPLTIQVAVFENAPATEVPRGENAGRTLKNYFVVRALHTERLIERAGADSAHLEVVVPIDRDWGHAGLGIAAWVQGVESMKMYGASVRRDLSRP